MAGSGRPAGTRLLERGEELACICQAITALRGGDGGVLLIQGAAGIGKSVLLDALCEAATGEGMQTLTARASELESEFGFGVVRQLLERRVVRADASVQAALLAGAAGLAGPVLGLGGAVGDSFAALHGLYWLLANLAVDGPVVVAVDDLQWADEPSLRWLIYLCRRLEGLPVLVAASTHPPRPGHSPLLAELVALRGVQILCPGPLHEPAIGQLLREGLGAQPNPAFIAACAKATGGNPFVLHELVLDLVADGVSPDAEQAAGVLQRVPVQVGRAVLARLHRLDRTAAQVAQAVTILGEGVELRQAAALAKRDITTAASAADALVTAELLAESRPLRFVHPLVRSAIYDQIPSGARAQAHAQAAHLLATEGAEPELIAGQLLACDPATDPHAVQALRAAAAAALSRGAPETAITYLHRALAEPPTDQVCSAVLAELGAAERIARNPAAATHLEQAWQATTDPITRAELAHQLANVLFMGDTARAIAALQSGVVDLRDRNPDLAVRLHVDKAALELLNVRPSEAPNTTLKRLREMATRSGPASGSAQLVLAAILAFRGEDCHEVAGLVECGWDHGRFLSEETSEAIPVILAVYALAYTDELERAQALAKEVLADAQARGSVTGFLAATARRGIVALRRGDLAEAEADTRAAFELAIEHHLTLSVPIQAAALGLTLLERGQPDQAAAVLQGVPLGLTIVGMPVGAYLLEARGRVHLARGQRAQAIADLRHCGRLADQAGWRNPNWLSWRSALALALEPEDGREARELAEAELELARRVGSARALGIALRVCGLLAGGTKGIELLEQSVTVLEATPMRLELARSLTEWGAALRRTGARAAAREPLRRALDLAARCGATPLVERAREEVLAAGARPRRPWASGVQALTPSELRVARLAAQDVGNREIAQALFITTKTVSDHLTSAYRKLNISSREQLATAMK